MEQGGQAGIVPSLSVQGLIQEDVQDCMTGRSVTWPLRCHPYLCLLGTGQSLWCASSHPSCLPLPMATPGIADVYLSFLFNFALQWVRRGCTRWHFICCCICSLWPNENCWCFLCDRKSRASKINWGEEIWVCKPSFRKGIFHLTDSEVPAALWLPFNYVCFSWFVWKADLVRKRCCVERTWLSLLPFLEGTQQSCCVNIFFLHY